LEEFIITLEHDFKMKLLEITELSKKINKNDKHAKNHYRCNKAIVITTSYFTNPAIELAKSNHVELWNRKKLDKMIYKSKHFEAFNDLNE